MKVPFVTQKAVVFECRSGTLCIGDLINAPARYKVRLKGICHLPGAAIVPADGLAPAFSVDNAQIFIIESDHYDAIAAAVAGSDRKTPNRDLLSKLREQHGTQFGYVVAGELSDSAFDGDGTFALDLSQLRKGLPVQTSSSADERELLRRIISSMNTLVCASCFSAEISEHPVFGESPLGRGKNKNDWCVAMADHALESGWTAIPESSSFGEVTPLCPACRSQRGP